jgi:hypothetical protein
MFSTPEPFLRAELDYHRQQILADFSEHALRRRTRSGRKRAARIRQARSPVARRAVTSR